MLYEASPLLLFIYDFFKKGKIRDFISKKRVVEGKIKTVWGKKLCYKARLLFAIVVVVFLGGGWRERLRR